ncbi:MAG: phage holin family protein [Coleofasciculaceae cyanobacterium SM2_1_6]|nr:phage holin family protein [Coleofasciculaceae cyanobacterium SM2_1_6]
MPRFLLTWLLTAIALILTSRIVPGFALDSITAAAIAAIIMGLVNAVVRPILVVLTLPLTLLTLGLFLLVVNALSLGLVAYFTPGFTITGFFPALIGSIVLSFVSGILDSVFQPKEA